MKINIVTVSSGWILQKIAEKIQEKLVLLCDSTLSHQPNLFADANFYLDIQNCYHHKTSTFDIGYFTHLHKDSVRSINPNWFSLDHIFHHGHRYFEVFKDFYPEEKMSVVLPGEIPKNFSIKKPCLGIFQRGGHEGKGHNFMKVLGGAAVAKSFQFLFVGGGWEEVVNQYTEQGIEVKYITDETYENYPTHYDNIDYLLIPSLWEGGPMSVIEAYAKGIPIISSNVGWVGTDFIVDYIYEPNNIKQLSTILNEILTPIMNRRKKVEHLKYANYAKRLYDTVKKLS